MEAIIGILKISRKFHVLLLVLPLLFGCSLYSYGVSQSNPDLKYKPLNNRVKNNYEFQSTLFYDDNLAMPFVVKIKHLAYTFPLSSELESQLIITFPHSKYNGKVNFRNFVLKHARNGKVLKPSGISFRSMDARGFLKRSALPDEYIISKKGFKDYLEIKKMYKLPMRPRNIDEYVYLEIYINRKQYIIKYDFPLEYKKEVTLWELTKFIVDTGR
jgi:hypothetical protein